MDKTTFLDQLQAKLAALLAATPAADVQRNMKAVLTQQFSKLELVTRDELDVQARVLARTREKLDALEVRVKSLEARSVEDTTPQIR